MSEQVLAYAAEMSANLKRLSSEAKRTGFCLGLDTAIKEALAQANRLEQAGDLDPALQLLYLARSLQTQLDAAARAPTPEDRGT